MNNRQQKRQLSKYLTECKREQEGGEKKEEKADIESVGTSG